MMCPIMLALTAASPIYRGYLSDIDVRWGVIAASVDDRTPEERGLQPLEHDKYPDPSSPVNTSPGDTDVDSILFISSVPCIIIYFFIFVCCYFYCYFVYWCSLGS
jgi:hypothetical protein